MTTVHMTFRQWVDEGARGSFLTPSVAVNAVRLINPLDRAGGYFVRRDTSAPDQQERRAQLALTDQNDGEREDRRMLARHRASGSAGHRHVLAYDSEPAGGGAAGGGEPWVVTARVERASEVVRRGWLGWETLGEVVLPARLAQH
jgi:hypothetical protein